MRKSVLNSYRRIRAIAHVELMQLLRDRPSLSLIFLVPFLQVVLFGYAVNFDPKSIPLVVTSNEPGAREHVAQLLRDIGYFKATILDGSESTALSKAARDKAVVIIALDRDAETGMRTIAFTADASDLTTVRTAMAKLEAAIWRNLFENSSFSDPPKVDVTWRYNPEQRADWSIAPALIGVVIMISCLMLGALTLVREREQGTWEALLVTPVQPHEVLVGKLSPYLFIGTAQALSIAIGAKFLFHLPVNYSPGTLVLLLMTPLYAFAHCVLGFVFSALAKNQMQAVQAAVLFYLPSMLLSGFMFSFRGMPLWARSIGELLPLTHYVRAARGAILRNDSAAMVAMEMLPVGVFSLAVSVLAIQVYRRNID